MAQRGKQTRNWWTTRWQDALALRSDKRRLARGKTYARNGSVLSIEVDQGLVRARVQGSRARPYKVELIVPTLSEAQWRKVARVLAGQAAYSAKLLAGEMPPQMEEVFAAAGLSLFPPVRGRPAIEASCSCPDWANPCKHVAAVYWLLGEEFDRDPFLMLRLRGISREALVGLVGRAGRRESGRADAGTVGRGAASGHCQASATIAGRLAKLASGFEVDVAPKAGQSVDPVSFWRGSANRLNETGAVPLAAPRAGTVPMPELGSLPVDGAESMLSVLGAPRFWRGKDHLDAVLRVAYDAAAGRAISLLAGDDLGRDASDEAADDGDAK